MKKLVPFWMTLCLMMGLLTACDNSNLDGLGKDANGAFSGDQLSLTYSGSTMLGKQATFYTSDGKKAHIKLTGLLDVNTLFPGSGIPTLSMMVPGVVPGEIETDLNNVRLTLSADGSYYSFEGSDSANGRELTYKGEVSASHMTLAVQNTMPTTDWNGMWKPASSNCFFLTWESSATVPFNGMNLPTSTLATMLSPMVSDLVAASLQMINFQDDGNVLVTYTKEGTKKTSPVNGVHYYVKDGKLYIQLHLTQLLAAQQTKSSASDIASMVKLLTGMADYLAGGIPLQYEQDADGNAKVWLATKDAKALLQLLTIEAVQEKLVALLPAEALAYLQPVLANLSSLLDATTTLEIGLQLKKDCCK